MPTVGCGVSLAKLTLGQKSTKHTIPYDKACKELGEERESRTANVDRRRSPRNEYSFPEGCGASGAALGDWLLARFEDYALEYGKTHRTKAGKPKRPPSSTALGIELVVTPDEEALSEWPIELRTKFMRDAFDVIDLWLGRPLDAVAVHVDEGNMEERGLARDDELGDEGAHGHAVGRIPDSLPDEALLREHLGEKGAAKFIANYMKKNKDDGCLYRTGTVLDKGRLFLLHRMFPAEMAKRGWREPVDENDLEATGWAVRVHETGAEKDERRKRGEYVKPSGLHANAYAHVMRAEDHAREQVEEAEADKAKAAKARHAAYNELRELGRARREHERDSAHVDVAEHGYEPPEGLTLVPPSAMPEDVRELWRYLYAEEGEDATYMIDDELWPPDADEPDCDAIDDAFRDWAEQELGRSGDECWFASRSGLWLVTRPEDYDPFPASPGWQEDSFDYLARDAAEEYADAFAEPRVREAELLGLDPLRSHPGLAAREAAVAERESASDRRERELDARESELDGRSERLDAELAGKRAESERLDKSVAAKRAESERLDGDVAAKQKRVDDLDARAKRAEQRAESAEDAVDEFLAGVRSDLPVMLDRAVRSFVRGVVNVTFAGMTAFASLVRDSDPGLADAVLDLKGRMGAHLRADRAAGGNFQVRWEARIRASIGRDAEAEVRREAVERARESERERQAFGYGTRVPSTYTGTGYDPGAPARGRDDGWAR